MDTLSEVSTRIVEAYLAKITLAAVVGPSPGGHEEQGKKLGELYAAVYKAVKEADQS